jgi:hypothetical protein
MISSKLLIFISVGCGFIGGLFSNQVIRPRLALASTPQSQATGGITDTIKARHIQIVNDSGTVLIGLDLEAGSPSITLTGRPGTNPIVMKITPNRINFHQSESVKVDNKPITKTNEVDLDSGGAEFDEWIYGTPTIHSLTSLKPGEPLTISRQ